MREVIKSIREFNRFYVNLMGILNANLFDSDYSLTESRIIFEIDAKRNLNARDLKKLLQIDEGYLSRLISRLMKREIISKKKSITDKRVSYLNLTDKGEALLAKINLDADKQLEDLLEKVKENDLEKITKNMIELKAILSKTELSKENRIN